MGKARAQLGCEQHGRIRLHSEVEECQASEGITTSEGITLFSTLTQSGRLGCRRVCFGSVHERET